MKAAESYAQHFAEQNTPPTDKELLASIAQDLRLVNIVAEDMTEATQKYVFNVINAKREQQGLKPITFLNNNSTHEKTAQDFLPQAREMVAAKRKHLKKESDIL